MTVEVEKLKGFITDYKTQYDALVQSLAQRDAQWAKEREQIVITIHQLEGALIALQTIVDNPPAPLADAPQPETPPTVVGTIVEEKKD